MKNRDMEELDALDKEIEKVRLNYEKYFAGVERREPLKQRDDCKRRLRRLQGVQTVNTARKFRIQNAQARLVTLEQYWNRITRQIEEGTYKRDRLKAQRRLAEEASPAAAARAKRGAARADDGYSDSLKSLHQDFLSARQQVGLKDKVSMKQLAATVAKQTAAIKAKYKCKDVDFKVAVKNGKAILKATPRK